MRITEPQSIRARIRHYASQPEPHELNPGLNGSIIGEIEKIIRVVHSAKVELSKGVFEKEETIYRKLLFGWLFGDENKPAAEMSSKALTPQMWYGLKKWIGAKCVDLGNGKVKWLHRPEFEEELWWIVAHAKCVYDFCNRYNLPLPIKQVNDWLQSSQIKENVIGWIEYEQGGIVSAGVQKGASVVTPIPWEEPLPVAQPIELIPLQAHRTVSTAFVEQKGSTVSYVDESEL